MIKAMFWTALISAPFAFAAGQRWEKGQHADFLEGQIGVIAEQAEQAMIDLNAAWLREEAKAKLDLQNWHVLTKQDLIALNQLLDGQKEIKGKFNDIRKDFDDITDFGTCNLSDAAIQLLRNASEATQRPGMSDD